MYWNHLNEPVSAEHEPLLQRFPLSLLLLLCCVKEALGSVDVHCSSTGHPHSSSRS